MSITSSTLSGAATGASVGMMVGGPAAPFTAAAGAVIGGAVSGVSAWMKENEDDEVKAESEVKQEQIRQEQLKNKARVVTNNSINKQNSMKANQYLDTTEYALGSNNIAPIDKKPIKMQGNLQQVSSNGAKVIGNSHEQGGVPTQTIDGQPAEVEGNEFIEGEGDTQRVYSNRLRGSDGNTFAQTAESLHEEKAALEQQSVDSIDRTEMDTNERMIEIIDMRLDSIYTEQEEAKALYEEQVVNSLINNK